MASNNSQGDLAELMFSIGRIIRERVCAEGLATPYLHHAVLHYISEKQQPLMREVAQYLRITPPSATSLVNSLAKSGLIKRINDPNDRRIVRLALTAKGEKGLEAGMQQKKKSIEKMMVALSEGERNDLKNILNKLIKVSA